jgi:hypothetical protein
MSDASPRSAPEEGTSTAMSDSRGSSPFNVAQLVLMLMFLLSAIDPVGGWLQSDFDRTGMSVGRLGAIAMFLIAFVPSAVAATMIVLVTQLHRRRWPPARGGRRFLSAGLCLCEISFVVVLLAYALGLINWFVAIVYLGVALLYVGRVAILIGIVLCLVATRKLHLGL